jgi:hypothetical protein
LTEYRQVDGIVSLAFASAIMDGTNAPEMQVCARLRMTLATAQGLRGTLDNLISDALKPVDKSKAN